MSEASLEQLKRFRAKIYLAHLFGMLSSILIVWGLWISNLLFGFDPVSTLRGSETQGPRFFLFLAIGVSVFALLFFGPKILQARALAKRGVWTRGNIAGVGLLGHHGAVAVRVGYSVDGVEFQVKKDMPRGKAAGDTVSVLYDPLNPRRAEATFSL